ncbi:MAG: biosynthetic peptidoglycan transglycosylase, partial [Acidimicrobiales bacterium]
SRPLQALLPFKDPSPPSLFGQVVFSRALTVDTDSPNSDHGARGPRRQRSDRAHRRRPPRRRNRSRRRQLAYAVLIAIMTLGILLGGGLLVLILTAPSVDGAPRRVAAILAAHGAPSDQGVIPAKVSAALLATEDSRYYEDPALDPLGVARAVMGVLTNNGNDGGATIEQQLAKMLYAPGTSPAAELEQVGVAFRLDDKFTKNQILAMYLNAAYFGDGAYGVTAAAERYFGVAPGQLTWAQATLLAGLVQAPSGYDPHGHLSLAKARQSHVLERLVAVHTLTAAQAAEIYRAPLDPAIAFYG